MVTLRQYLEQNAKFLSPETGGDIINSSEINDIEADSLEARWKSAAARRDDQMVDSLLKTLHDHLGDRPLPVEQARLDRLFQPLVDDDGTHPQWRRRNAREHDVSYDILHSGMVFSLTSFNKTRLQCWWKMEL